MVGTENRKDDQNIRRQRKRNEKRNKLSFNSIVFKQRSIVLFWGGGLTDGVGCFIYIYIKVGLYLLLEYYIISRRRTKEEEEWMDGLFLLVVVVVVFIIIYFIIIYSYYSPVK